MIREEFENDPYGMDMIPDEAEDTRSGNAAISGSDKATAEAAGILCTALLRQIRRFESKLAPEEDMGIQFTGLHQPASFILNGLSFYNPHLVCFYGHFPDGSYGEVVQHVSQVSFMLQALPASIPRDTRPPVKLYGAEDVSLP